MEKDIIVIKKTSLKKAGKIVFCIYVLVFSIFMIVSQINVQTTVTDLLDKFNNLTTSSSDSSEISTLQISAMTYYKDYELDDSVDISKLADGNDYMIYFHSDSCSYCLEANVFLNQYITLGYQNNVPIYFATIDTAPELFDDVRFQIESTPTMYYYSASDKTYSGYIGVDDIFTLLDQIVSNAS